MSPRESPVKINGLGFKPQTKVNIGENEGGSHDMLSLPARVGLNIGWCGEKDPAAGLLQLFLVNAPHAYKNRGRLDLFIMEWLWEGA